MIVSVSKGKKYEQFLKVEGFPRVWDVYGKWSKVPRFEAYVEAVEEGRPIGMDELERYAEELSKVFGYEVELGDALRIGLISWSKEIKYADKAWRGGLPREYTQELKVWFPVGSENAIYVRPAFLTNIVALIKYTYGEEVEVDFSGLRDVRKPIVSRKVVDEIQSILWDHQRRTIDVLESLGWYGAAQIPTGGGKTLVGAYIAASLRVPTVILAPTIDILRQWERELLRIGFPSSDIGYVGGGKKNFGKPVLLMTYTSAYRERSTLINYAYELVILDEVHRVSAKTFTLGVLSIPALYRVGLTATYWRSEKVNNITQMKLAPLVFEAHVSELVNKGALAKPEVIFECVEIDDETLKKLSESLDPVIKYCKERCEVIEGEQGIKALKPNKKFFLAFEDKVLNRIVVAISKCNAKLKRAVEILKDNADKKAVVFAEYRETARKIASMLKKEKIPVYLLLSDSKDERKGVLDAFRMADRGVLVTAKLGDEGLNLPDVELGIILASRATTQTREFIQRLGRIVRTSKGKEGARLYVLVCMPKYDPQVFDKIEKYHEAVAKEFECIEKGTDVMLCGNRIHTVFMRQVAYRMCRDVKMASKYLELLRNEREVDVEISESCKFIDEKEGERKCASDIL